MVRPIHSISALSLSTEERRSKSSSHALQRASPASRTAALGVDGSPVRESEGRSPCKSFQFLHVDYLQNDDHEL